MVDRALRLTVRNFWTLFFAVAAVTVPLQLAYATAWHNVIAVRELHADIARFPPLRQVHSVGRSQLHDARLTYWVIVAVELVLLPLFVRAARRVVETDAAGGVPSALDALRGAFARGGGSVLRALARPGPLVTGLAVAVAVGALASAAGHLLIEPVGDDRAFAAVGLVDGVARALAAPFFLVIAALAAWPALSPSRRDREAGPGGANSPGGL